MDLLSDFYTQEATLSPHFSKKIYWPTKLRGNSRETPEVTNCYVNCNSKSLCQWWQAGTKRHVCSLAQHVSFKAFLSKINQINFSVWTQKQHTGIIKSEFQVEMSHCQTHYFEKSGKLQLKVKAVIKWLKGMKHLEIPR